MNKNNVWPMILRMNCMACMCMCVCCGCAIYNRSVVKYDYNKIYGSQFMYSADGPTVLAAEKTLESSAAVSTSSGASTNSPSNQKEPEIDE